MIKLVTPFAIGWSHLFEFHETTQPVLVWLGPVPLRCAVEAHVPPWDSKMSQNWNLISTNAKSLNVTKGSSITDHSRSFYPTRLLNRQRPLMCDLLYDIRKLRLTWISRAKYWEVMAVATEARLRGSICSVSSSSSVAKLNHYPYTLTRQKYSVPFASAPEMNLLSTIGESAKSRM
jgi:hypothetical protein